MLFITGFSLARLRRNFVIGQDKHSRLPYVSGLIGLVPTVQSAALRDHTFIDSHLAELCPSGNENLFAGAMLLTWPYPLLGKLFDVLGKNNFPFA